jgi:hypothetical protein
MTLRDPRTDWSPLLHLAALLCLGVLSASLTVAILRAGGLP